MSDDIKSWEHCMKCRDGRCNFPNDCQSEFSDNPWVTIPAWPRDGAKVEFETKEGRRYFGCYTDEVFEIPHGCISRNCIKRWRYIEETKKPWHWKCLCGKEGYRDEGESFGDHINSCKEREAWRGPKKESPWTPTYKQADRIIQLLEHIVDKK